MYLHLYISFLSSLHFFFVIRTPWRKCACETQVLLLGFPRHAPAQPTPCPCGCWPAPPVFCTSCAPRRAPSRPLSTWRPTWPPVPLHNPLALLHNLHIYTLAHYFNVHICPLDAKFRPAHHIVMCTHFHLALTSWQWASLAKGTNQIVPALQ